MMKKLFFMIFFLTNFAFGQDFGVDSLTFTRPANAIAYTAGDAINTSTTAGETYLFRLRNAALNNAGSGVIESVVLVVDTTYTAGAVKLWFYVDSSRHNQIADNAAFTGDGLTSSSKIVGTATLTFTGAGTASATITLVDATTDFPFTCQSGSNSLYMRVTCITTFTPKVSGKYVIVVRYRERT